MQRILVTGAAGYIGSVVTRQLLLKNYKVRAFDILNFGGEGLIDIYNHKNFEFIKGDIRKEADIRNAIKEVDAVVHLAAIVGDPACAAQPEVAATTNLDASMLLLDICQETLSVKRFVFASTCSNYGKMEGSDFLNEESPLHPVSLYAELKVKFEKYLLGTKKRSDFIATVLRFATVYGVSSRMRFDLTVNEFMREVALGRELIIFGEQFWRPYCHVSDLASSCLLVLESEGIKVANNVFGVGDTHENYQKKMIAEEIIKIIPYAKVKYIQRNEDPRDYRVDFNKIKSTLGFNISKTVPVGLEEVNSIIKNGILSDPDSKKYSNT